MTSNLFYKLLRDNFPFEPTLKQDIFFQKVADFVLNSSNNELFVLKGYAGTGKTTVISTIVNQLKNVNQKYLLLAPTGRAAKVISNIHKSLLLPFIRRYIFQRNRVEEESVLPYSQINLLIQFL